MDNTFKNVCINRLDKLIRMKEVNQERLKLANNESGEESFLLQNRLRNEIEAFDKSIAQIKHRLENNDSVIRTARIAFEDTIRDIKVVSEELTDPEGGYVSNESPLGRAIISAKRGQDVSILTPNGREKIYRVIAING